MRFQHLFVGLAVLLVRTLDINVVIVASVELLVAKVGRLVLWPARQRHLRGDLAHGETELSWMAALKTAREEQRPLYLSTRLYDRNYDRELR